MANPWNAGQVESELSVVHGLRLVAENGGEFAGYVFFRFCAPEAELLRIAVSSMQQGKGIGTSLLAAGIQELNRLSITTCFLEVRCSNMAAQTLYQSAGFIKVGIRPRYYVSPVEDAVQMSKSLGDYS